MKKPGRRGIRLIPWSLSVCLSVSVSLCLSLTLSLSLVLWSDPFLSLSFFPSDSFLVLSHSLVCFIFIIINITTALSYSYLLSVKRLSNKRKYYCILFLGLIHSLVFLISWSLSF